MIAFAAILVALASVVQDTLPPIPPSLVGAIAVTCVHVTDQGTVDGAFIVVSAGDAANDRDILAWVKQLHWDPASMGDTIRNRWFPMPISFGRTPAPPMPSTCSP
jgi:TonB family protein